MAFCVDEVPRLTIREMNCGSSNPSDTACDEDSLSLQGGELFIVYRIRRHDSQRSKERCLVGRYRFEGNQFLLWPEYLTI